jgi:ATP-binding cassette subfamily B protein
VWSRATLLCVTHDISETAQFERVLVMEGGRIVEDGHPARLLSDARSVYARLFEAERATQTALAHAGRWKRLEFCDGRLQPLEDEA